VDVCHPLREVVYVCQGEMLIISDNELPENIVGVHGIKSIKDEKPSTLPTIFGEASDRKDASAWAHHKLFHLKTLLIGNGNCACEHFILMETDERRLMISSSDDGFL
jgi:hypothetical protein